MVDISQTFRTVCAQSDSPIYARILDIHQDGSSHGGKSFQRRYIARSRKRGCDADDEEIELRYVPARNGYIAVSCPWQLPISDNTVTGKYRIRSDFKVNIPQDLVLDRVIKFAAAKQNQYPFWIDKLCIDQDDDSSEKPTAIQSMDQVYKESKISLGLLFTRIDSKEQVKHLHALLTGECATKQYRRGKVEYVLITTIEEARGALKIADLVVKDSWWNRAWIFQEEYLSQLRMLLLIRSSQYSGGHGQFHSFGNIPGELQIEAVKFRTEATILCLAFLRQRTVSQRDRGRCNRILRNAGKYNILLDRNKSGKTLKAMSPVIFQEIGRRDITDAWDILAIASNSCDFMIRMDPHKLRTLHQRADKSLSLAILTTCILNGEILRHDSRSGKAFNGDVFQFLKQNILDINPPLESEKGLTFIKHCRYSSIKLYRQGMETEGIVWKREKVIQLPTKFMRQSASEWLRDKVNRHGPQKTSRFQYKLNVSEITALWRLVGWLLYGEDRPYRHLANRLSYFLMTIVPAGYNDDWTFRHIMSIMATNVARAIQDNWQLQLGHIDHTDGTGRNDGSPYGAIFVRDTRKFGDSCSVFTSWTCVEDILEGRLLATSCAKFASLEISLSTSTACRPTMKPKRWINGLCFFLNADARKVMVPWPKSIAG